MRKIHRIMSVLLALSLVFVIALQPLEAEAFGMGQIRNVAITFSMPPVNAAEVDALSVSSSASGCYISSVVWRDVRGQVMADRFTNENATVEIVVTAASGYYFSGGVNVTIDGEAAVYENYSSELHISKTFSPVIWAPTMVKHPSDEKVIEGGVASFVSYASCVNKSNWEIMDSKGNFYSIDALAEKFPELVIEPSFDKLNISPISKELNGFKVRCAFTGPGGSINSYYAEIIVIPLSPETPPPTPVPAVQSGTEASPEPTPQHDHKYGAKLSYDAGYHWYGCECGDMISREEHNYTWIQKSVATLESMGSIRGECRDCGYVINYATELDPTVVVEMRNGQQQEDSREEQSFFDRFFGSIASFLRGRGN